MLIRLLLFSFFLSSVLLPAQLAAFLSSLSLPDGDEMYARASWMGLCKRKEKKYVVFTTSSDGTTDSGFALRDGGQVLTWKSKGPFHQGLNVFSLHRVEGQLWHHPEKVNSVGLHDGPPEEGAIQYEFSKLVDLFKLKVCHLLAHDHVLITLLAHTHTQAVFPPRFSRYN
jgi:hypothetical protein